jgi:Tol biopolymer transport system component
MDLLPCATVTRIFRFQNAAIAALLLVAPNLGACRTSHTASSPPVAVRKVEFPGEENLGTWRVAPALSPNGQILAYTQDGMIRTRGVDSTAERSYSVPDSADWRPTSVSWHPDGDRLLSLERHRSRGWRIALTELATAARRIVSVSKNRTKLPAVSPDGRHIALVRATESWDERDELRLIELPAGAERVLVNPERGTVISSLAWSPWSDRVAFLLSSSREEDRAARIEISRLASSREVLVREEDGRRLTGPAGTERSMAWLGDGRLVYTRCPNPDAPDPETELYFVALDAKGGTPAGPKLLFHKPGYVLETPSASAETTLIVIAHTAPRGTRDLDLAGAPAPVVQNTSSSKSKSAGAPPRPVTAMGAGAWPREGESPVFCAASRCVQARRDGKEIVFQAYEKPSDSGTILFRRPIETVGFAGISPDGKSFAMGSATSDSVEIVDATTGVVRDRIVIPGRGIVQAAAWAPAGEALYVSGVLMDPRYWIRKVPLTGTASTKVLWASEDVWAGNPVPSPDGTRLSFQTRELKTELWRLDLPSRAR